MKTKYLQDYERYLNRSAIANNLQQTGYRTVVKGVDPGQIIFVDPTKGETIADAIKTLPSSQYERKRP